jgi:hypothetical protein
MCYESENYAISFILPVTERATVSTSYRRQADVRIES